MAENQFYFDANIWLDIYEKRGYRGEMAKQFFETIIIKKDVIFYSDLVISELRKIGYPIDEISQILSMAKPDHLRRVHIFKRQIDEARKVAKRYNFSKADALHAIVARDNQLQLISRDSDFQRLKHITIAKLPEDFL